ncbi:MAG TPA: hypothetical protein V6C97_15955 [Oculatellaceae cyanobacterium]
MQKSKGMFGWVGAIAALLCALLGFAYGWGSDSGIRVQCAWGQAGTRWRESAMDRARNADTSNFDNILQF